MNEYYFIYFRVTPVTDFRTGELVSLIRRKAHKTIKAHTCLSAARKIFKTERRAQHMPPRLKALYIRVDGQWQSLVWKSKQ